jgi:hypothetical protein
MRRAFSIPSQVALLAMLAGLALPACSNDEVGPMLYIDVSLSQGTSAPASVHFDVMQAQTLLAKADYNWPAGQAMLKVGIPIPNGAAGTVTVKASGKDSLGNEVSAGTSAESPIGSQSISIVLTAVPQGGPDGGTDALPSVGDTGTDGVANQDAGPDAAAADEVREDSPAADQIIGADRAGGDGVTTDGPADVASDSPPGRDGGTADRVGPTPEVPIADGPGAEAAAPDGRPSDTGIDGPGATRSWSKPVQVQPESDSYVWPPSLAMHRETGNAVIAWPDSTLGVLAAAYTAATDSWAAPVTVSTDENVDVAKVMVDAKGHYAIVWSKRGDGKDAATPGIRAAFSSDGATWSKPVQLFAGGATNYDLGMWVAMNGNGQAMVVWDHYQTDLSVGSPHILYSMYIEGTANQPAASVTTLTSEFDARLAIDGSGNGIIAWTAPDPVAKEESIWAATFAKQTVGAPGLVENYDADRAELPAVAMNSLGQGIVVWQQYTSSNTEIYGRRYSVAGSWEASPEMVIRTASSGTMKSVVLDDRGTASLVWSRANSSGYQCAFSTQAFGGTWSTENLETDDLATSLYVEVTETEPVVAVDGSGNVLVGWRKKISDTEFVPHLRWRIGNTWGPDVQIGLVPDMFSSDMALGVASDGRAIAAWTYYQCAPDWRYASTVCPTAKAWDKLSAESKAAWGTIFASSYR